MNKVFAYAFDEGLLLSVQYSIPSKTLMEIFQNHKETLIEITPLERTCEVCTQYDQESNMIDIEIDGETEAETTIEIDVGLSRDIECAQY